ncbi:histone methylation protein DOT1-domain-containing protein, partial [Tricladium varicosporioides]
DRDIGSSSHLKVKRTATGRQKSPNRQDHQVKWDEDESEESDEEGSPDDRKRQRTEEPVVDLKRQLRSRKAFSEEFGKTFDMVHAVDVQGFSNNYKIPPDASVEDVIVKVKYPSASQRERFDLRTGRDKINAAEEIVQIFEIVKRVYLPDDIKYDRDIVRTRNLMRREMTRDRIIDFKGAVEEYNSIVQKYTKNGVLARKLDDMHQLPFDQVRLMLQQVYDRAVSPNVDNLRKYENGTDNVYGELLPPLVSRMLKEVDLRSDQVFVDLGSGVGNVVLQAALQFGSESWGCEMMENACDLAEKQEKEFKARCRLWGVQPGKVRLRRGDFLENDSIKKIIQTADVILVNNQAFTSELNQRLTDLFLDAKEGCKIVSLRSFVPSGHQITPRNIGNPANVLEVTRWEYYAQDVSWTDAGGSYFIATKDSRQLRKF